MMVWGLKNELVVDGAQVKHSHVKAALRHPKRTRPLFLCCLCLALLVMAVRTQDMHVKPCAHKKCSRRGNNDYVWLKSNTEFHDADDSDGSCIKQSRALKRIVCTFLIH